jgi:hypothetical protein
MKTRSLGIVFLFPAVLGLIAVAPGCSDSPTQSRSPFPAVDPLDVHNQADMLVITPESLSGGLPRLVAHRRAQGLSVGVVTLEEIATAFPDAPSVEDGIRSFISYAFENWTEPKAAYVLLVGDTDVIPTFYFPSSLTTFGEGDVATDDPYATIEGDDDDFPDLALGRFPASNLDELGVVVGKTLAYEGTGGSYASDGVFVADYADGDPLGLSFEQIAAALAGEFPEGAAIRRIDVRSDSPNVGTSATLFADLGSGARLLTYLGHGNETIWGNDHFVTVADLPSFPTDGNPTVIVTSTSDQRFTKSGGPVLVRELLGLDSGGAVASVAPSGLSLMGRGQLMLSSFYTALWEGPDHTVGKALLAAKRFNQAGLDGDFESQASRYTLLGDPALRVPVPGGS